MLLALASAARAAEKTALDLLPPTTVGYLEVPQPGKVLGVVLDHPLAREIAQQPGYQKALGGREYQQVQAALKLVEDKLGKNWRQAFGSLTSGGLYVGFDLPTQGIVALLQADDETLAREGARCGSWKWLAPPPPKRASPIRSRRTSCAASRCIRSAMWILPCSASGCWCRTSGCWSTWCWRTIWARGASLGSDEQFQAVRKSRRADAAAWLYVDLRVLRLTGALAKAANKKSNNPPAELLAGGILGVLPDASYVTASLEMDASRLKLVGHAAGQSAGGGQDAGVLFWAGGERRGAAAAASRRGRC